MVEEKHVKRVLKNGNKKIAIIPKKSSIVPGDYVLIKKIEVDNETR